MACAVFRCRHSSMNSCRRSSNSSWLWRRRQQSRLWNSTVGLTLIFRNATLFSLHHAKASVQLWACSAPSIRRMSVNRSMSTKDYIFISQCKTQSQQTTHTPRYPSSSQYRAPYSPSPSSTPSPPATYPAAYPPICQSRGPWCLGRRTRHSGAAACLGGRPAWACPRWSVGRRAGVSY